MVRRRQDGENEVGDLACAETLVLHGLRTWVTAFAERECGLLRLVPFYRRAGVPDVAAGLHAILLHTALSATRPVDIRCPGCLTVSPDESRIIAAIGLMQKERVVQAYDLLSDWLPAEVAHVVIRAVQTIARAMQDARLDISPTERRRDGRHAAGTAEIADVAESPGTAHPYAPTPTIH